MQATKELPSKQSASAPSKDAAEQKIQLLSKHFFARTDRCAILAPWKKPCPAQPDDLGVAIRAHVQGPGSPIATFNCHLRGRTKTESGHFRLGSYCLAPDNTVNWLCGDVDGPSHGKDGLTNPDAVVQRIVQRTKNLQVPSYIERSASGDGWHLWLFFCQPLAAAKARQLGKLLFADEVLEVFPKQDKLTASGLGNMVWLPFWSDANPGCGEFYKVTDGHFAEFLPASLETITEDRIDQLLRENSRADVSGDSLCQICAAAPTTTTTRSGSVNSLPRSPLKPRDRCQLNTREHLEREHLERERPINQVLKALSNVKGDGPQYSARCPAHEDNTNSLSVSTDDRGNVLLYCHAGCSTDDIVASLGMSMSQLFNHSPLRSQVNGKSSSTAPSVDWATLVHDFEANLTNALLEQLSNALGVPSDALRELSVGWSKKLQAHTFPERDFEGNIIGICTRDSDGRKSMLKESKRGLYLPASWQEQGGPIFVVEGASDTAAAIAMNLACIGRPSANGGAELLAKLLAAVPKTRSIVVMGEFDPKQDGHWPGRDSAKNVAREVSNLLGRSVHWALPPVGAKDIRTWLTQENTRGD